jgi:uncharacterized protein (TIGR00369 family)
VTSLDYDPVELAADVARLDGLSALRALIAGELPPPPIAILLGFEPVEVEEGRVVLAAEPSERHYNPIGMVHGGLAATLCDSAMGCAVHSTLPAGTAYTTLELKVNYIRALTKETGLIRCEGKTIAVGGRIATAEARMTDEAGTLYAHATTTCLIIRPQKRERA